jgi:dGTPase
VLAYLSHDLDDALAGAFIDVADLSSVSEILAGIAASAEARWREDAAWPEEEHETLVRRRIVAQLIGKAIADVGGASSSAIASMAPETPDDVRNATDRVVVQSPDHEEATRQLLKLLTERYYRSELVRASDERAATVVRALFEEFVERPDQMPARFREVKPPVNAALYVASLNDRSASALAERWGLAQTSRA